MSLDTFKPEFNFNPEDTPEQQLMIEILHTQDRIGYIIHHDMQTHPKYRSEFSRLKLRLKYLQRLFNKIEDKSKCYEF